MLRKPSKLEIIHLFTWNKPQIVIDCIRICIICISFHADTVAGTLNDYKVPDSKQNFQSVFRSFFLESCLLIEDVSLLTDIHTDLAILYRSSWVSMHFRNTWEWQECLATRQEWEAACHNSQWYREWAARQWLLLSATQHQKHLRAQTLTETLSEWVNDARIISRSKNRDFHFIMHPWSALKPMHHWPCTKQRLLKM